MDEYKKKVQNERKKFAYAFVGLAVVIHALFLASKIVAYAVGVAALAVLLVALWKATTGRRLGMNIAFLLALVVHGGVLVYDYYFGVDIAEEEKVVRFQPPPPILEKNFDLAKRPEISEVQMEMLQSMAPPDMPTDISAMADVSAVGSDLLQGVMPGTQVLGQFSGAKAEELSFDDVEMVQLTETAAPVQEALSLKARTAQCWRLGCWTLPSDSYSRSG